MSNEILYFKEGCIGWIVFNRPEAQNALNYAMTEGLEKTLNQINAEDNVRVVILTGQGEKSFMAGSDIRELKERDTISGCLDSQKR
jgi:enoyl-CoA hydratase